MPDTMVLATDTLDSDTLDLGTPVWATTTASAMDTTPVPTLRLLRPWSTTPLLATLTSTSPSPSTSLASPLLPPPLLPEATPRLAGTAPTPLESSTAPKPEEIQQTLFLLKILKDAY